MEGLAGSMEGWPLVPSALEQGSDGNSDGPHQAQTLLCEPRSFTAGQEQYRH